MGFQFDEDLLEGNLLDLEQGLTVFYGLNGAGKSRLVRGIQDALVGKASDTGVHLVVRIPEEVAPQSSERRSDSAPNLVDALGRVS